MPPYAELHCLSNFTFLRGASHPEELVAQAAELGYAALSITDECSLAGVVRAHVAAREAGLRLIVGSEVTLEDGVKLVLLAMDRAGYGALSGLISVGRRRAEKGHYRLGREELSDIGERLLALWLPGEPLAGGPRSDEAWAERGDEAGEWVAATFPGRAWLAVELHRGADDRRKLVRLRALGRRVGLPLVAAGGALMHVRERQRLQETLTAIRLNTPLRELGFALHPNGERHLRPRATLARLYPRELLEESARIAERCTFSLDELRYEYPRELVPEGHSPASWLRALTEEGMARRWPEGPPARVRELVARELELVAELRYEPFFLTVHDIVRFARGRGILCQGRGSAANSAVCYCLGITEVDPSRMELLFERFISRERGEPPDIDVDFEHERREEVIQYIYARYGRERAALAAAVIAYRPRSALRDVGRALGLGRDQIERLAAALSGWSRSAFTPERVREAGLDPQSPVVAQLLALCREIIGFPRHLSQHVGGFVISRGPLAELVPVENAAMAGRTVIQWDKDDLEALGLLKVDVLALGMLSAIRRALELVNRRRGTTLTLAGIPPEVPEVYRMISRGETMGVFQIESRAQMAMLPRLRPRNFYDLVIEVAIVRPGPIQGDMVHPYLRRREGREAVEYPSEAARGVLERTLGVPIFQEQVIKLAMVAAGFSGGEADALRRAMAAWRRKGGLEPFERKLIDGMRARGYEEAFARRLFEQIKGFGEYGFPESHAASFALLVYASAWLKCFEPAAFTAALLNSQPMGFYAPSQLVQEARRQGVEVRPVDARFSAWTCTLEEAQGAEGEYAGTRHTALRLGLRLVKGLSRAGAERLAAARAGGDFDSVEALALRARLNRADLEALAAADALAGLAGNRHLARWRVAGVEAPTPLFRDTFPREATPLLPRPGEGAELVADFAATGLSLRRHPLALLRPRLRRLRTAAELRGVAHGRLVRTAGLVINRQRPGTASGAIFVTLEDESGHTNVIVWRDLAERQRRELLGARLLAVVGIVEREGEVLHLIAGRLEDLSHLLGGLEVRSRDFH